MEGTPTRQKYQTQTLQCVRSFRCMVTSLRLWHKIKKKTCFGNWSSFTDGGRGVFEGFWLCRNKIHQKIYPSPHKSVIFLFPPLVFYSPPFIFFWRRLTPSLPLENHVIHPPPKKKKKTSSVQELQLQFQLFSCQIGMQVTIAMKKYKHDIISRDTRCDHVKWHDITSRHLTSHREMIRSRRNEL